MSNVKKIIISIGVILVIITTSFICGYSTGRSKFDDSRIAEDTELIRRQDETIEAIENGVQQGLTETVIIKDEIEHLTNSVNIIDSGLRELETGLSKDIEGISGVIERLKYYRDKDAVLEKSNSD